MIVADSTSAGPIRGIARGYHAAVSMRVAFLAAECEPWAKTGGLADVVDALISDRPYRPGWSREKVLAYTRENAGSQFDPSVVEAYLRIEAAGRGISPLIAAG